MFFLPVTTPLGRREQAGDINGWGVFMRGILRVPGTGCLYWGLGSRFDLDTYTYTDSNL